MPLPHREPQLCSRLAAAALKSAGVDLGQLYRAIELAEFDWRDVIAKAEYARYCSKPIGSDRHAEIDADGRENQQGPWR